MQAVLFAGGAGRRIQPVTQGMNKHLLPVHDRLTVVEHGITALARAGVTEFLIITNRDDTDVIRALLSSNPALGSVEWTIAASKSPHQSLAEVLMLARGFVRDEEFLVLFGDNVFLHGGVQSVQRSVEYPGPRIVLARAPDPSRFGVASFNGATLARLAEKPSDPPLNALVVTGLMRLTKSSLAILDSLPRNERGELQDGFLTSFLNVLIDKRLLGYDIAGEPWFDVGTPRAYELLLSHGGGERPALSRRPQGIAWEVAQEFSCAEKIRDVIAGLRKTG